MNIRNLSHQGSDMPWIFKATILALMLVIVPVQAQQDNQRVKLSDLAKQGCKAVVLSTGITFLTFVIFKELTQFRNLKSYLLLNIPAAACTAAVGAYLCKHNYIIIRSEYAVIKAALQQYKESNKQRSSKPDLLKKDLPYHVTFKF